MENFYESNLGVFMLVTEIKLYTKHALVLNNNPIIRYSFNGCTYKFYNNELLIDKMN